MYFHKLRTLTKNNYQLTRFLNGSSIIYNKLKEKKVKDVFLYSGGAIMPLVDKFYHGEINYYINTHEQSSGHAATGYAKTSNKTGVCVVTSGPGLTNMITPILDANNDSTPLIVFSGQVSRTNMGSDAFQECPATDITKPVTKWSYCVETVEELPEVMDNAFRIANTGKKGAVHIDLPKDILVNELDESLKTVKVPSSSKVLSSSKVPSSSKKFKHNSNLSFENLAKLINQAQKPVFYIGQGCNNYPKLLRKLVKKSNIPITTTIHAMGVFDEEHPLSLEFLGMHGNVAANKAIQESDCIIAIGSRFDDRTTGSLSKYAPEAFLAYQENRGGIIHCNIESKEINKVIDSHFNYETDAGIFMKNLLTHVTYQDRHEWINKIKEYKNNYPFVYDKNPNKLKTQEVISEINSQVLHKNLWKNTIFTTGVGNHQMMAAQFIKWKKPKTFISSGSLGVMGVGLPYAIGVQIANPKSIVIDIDGDGSFNHTLSELKTIVEYNLPVKIAIMNDKNLTMVKIWEELFFDARYTATASEKNPDYVNLAKSYGIHAISCHKPSDLSNKVDYFLNYPGPILCEFKLESDKCFPLVAPGKGLDEMLLHSSLSSDNTIIDKTLPPS